MISLNLTTFNNRQHQPTLKIFFIRNEDGFRSTIGNDYWEHR